MTAKVWKLSSHFEGVAKLADFRLDEEQLPPVSQDEISIEGIFFSLDPYMKAFSRSLKLGSVMMGEQVAKVVESKNDSYRVGDLVLARVGWRDKTVLKPIAGIIRPIWDTAHFPKSYALGLVGMPGLSALLGFLPICDPQPRETVFVNSSAGTVGSIVGMIGKIKGCKVIGCAGTDEKVKYVKEFCGFDEVFNYKTSDLHSALKKLAPNGIDCYFDNVGGEFTSEVIINHMNPKGRISCCGNLSGYNEKDPQKGRLFSFHMFRKELKMQGFMIPSHEAHFKEGSAQLLQWAIEGKLKIKENVVKGFENLPTGLIDLLDGKYIGKVVVQA